MEGEKEHKMGIYWIGQCNMGWKANLLHCAVKAFYVSVCTVFLCLGLSSAQQFGFFCEHDKIHVPGTA
jgi:hypothetical protein